MGYESHVAEAKRRFQKATGDGLLASAQVYVNAVKRGLRGGYTSGEFVTGNVINSVTAMPGEGSRTYELPDGTEVPTPKAAVQVHADGQYVEVGTNLDYAFWWEIGHHNLWMWDGGGQGPPFVRVEIWYPEFVAQQAAMQRAFGRVYRRTLKEMR